MIAKKEEVQETIKYTNDQIAQVDSDIAKIKSQTSEYSRMIQNIKEMNEKLTQKYETKDAIPNLLYNIMYSIPKEVQITSIENTTGKHIVINAQSEKYEQLGYFKTVLNTEGYLKDVTAGSGVKQNGIISVTIEGELP